MKSGYVLHEPVTRTDLDRIEIGDLVKINDWTVPYRVVGVSENFFAMIRKQFGKISYSVVSKNPWKGSRHNDLYGGCFFCGPDDWLFGDPAFDYQWDDTFLIDNYLHAFEAGINHISERRGMSIHSLQHKSMK